MFNDVAKRTPSQIEMYERAWGTGGERERRWKDVLIKLRMAQYNETRMKTFKKSLEETLSIRLHFI